MERLYHNYPPEDFKGCSTRSLRLDPNTRLFSLISTMPGTARQYQNARAVSRPTKRFGYARQLSCATRPSGSDGGLRSDPSQSRPEKQFYACGPAVFHPRKLGSQSIGSRKPNAHAQSDRRTQSGYPMPGSSKRTAIHSMSGSMARLSILRRYSPRYWLVSEVLCLAMVLAETDDAALPQLFRI
jgi:hypothetical protein